MVGTYKNSYHTPQKTKTLLQIFFNYQLSMIFIYRQEGVETNWYFAKTVEVFTPEGEKIECRTYQQTINPPIRDPDEELPAERRPSSTYLDCIINGAIECNLPQEYIIQLKKIPHNGQKASPKMIEKLNM